jgi:hypothetical protein
MKPGLSESITGISPPGQTPSVGPRLALSRLSFFDPTTSRQTATAQTQPCMSLIDWSREQHTPKKKKKNTKHGNHMAGRHQNDPWTSGCDWDPRWHLDRRRFHGRPIAPLPCRIRASSFPLHTCLPRPTSWCSSGRDAAHLFCCGPHCCRTGIAGRATPLAGNRSIDWPCCRPFW